MAMLGTAIWNWKAKTHRHRDGKCGKEYEQLEENRMNVEKMNRNDFTDLTWSVAVESRNHS